MRLLARVALAFCTAASPWPAAFARDEAANTAAQSLVAFRSDEGLARLARSGAKVDVPALAKQFQAQSNGAFCGPAGFDPSPPRFTQDNVIGRGSKTRAQALDEQVIVNHRRAEVGQAGGAHTSPLGAYNVEYDTVLLLDVNPASAGWVWMPLVSPMRGMRTFDTVENRGYILVRSR